MGVRRGQESGKTFRRGTWTAAEPTDLSIPLDPCGRVVDHLREFYTTWIQFGTNSSRVAKIRWYEASPEAKDLGFPTPFVSRNWDQWEIWPEIGEVQWASRERNDGSFPIPVSGVGKPCGLPEVWARGTVGTPLPIYPRNKFGLAACCGGLLDRQGEPIFGLDVQISFSVGPFVSTTPTDQQWTIKDDLADMCGTLNLAKKSVYPEPWLWRMLKVDDLDDSNPQRELIFGGE